MSILLVVVGLVLLFFGGDFLVKGAAGLALRANIPPMLVGLTVVAMGTSAPELLVSFQAAIEGKGDIAMGNVVGSNIANIALILGITALIFPLTLSKKILTNEWLAMMLASLGLLFFLQDGELSQMEGAIFVFVLVSYIIQQFYISRKKTVVLADLDIPADAQSKSIYVLLAFIVGGSVALIFGARWFLDGAIAIAQNFGISDRVIAITLIAFGTSVPELAASVIAAYRRHNDISLGNIIGSNLFNILAILGISSSTVPISVSDAIVDRDLYWMIGISALILPFTLIRSKLGKTEGAILLGVYVFYIFLLF